MVRRLLRWLKNVSHSLLQKQVASYISVPYQRIRKVSRLRECGSDALALCTTHTPISQRCDLNHPLPSPATRDLNGKVTALCEESVAGSVQER